MSKNNQTLIREHRGNWYIFHDVMAESWCDMDDDTRINELHISEAVVMCHTKEEALDKAQAIDKLGGQFDEGTEYGVHEKLFKDGQEVKIIG